MQPTAGAQHAAALGEHGLGIGEQLGEVAQGHEVEVPVREAQAGGVALLEEQPRPRRSADGTRCAAACGGPAEGLRGAQHRRQNIHSGDGLGPRKGSCEPPDELPGAAAEIEQARAGRQRVPRQQPGLLRPGRLGLETQRAQHRGIGHLRRLRVARIEIDG